VGKDQLEDENMKSAFAWHSVRSPLPSGEYRTTVLDPLAPALSAPF
jgi:hypothetical protein